jgi:hypothetical protein
MIPGNSGSEDYGSTNWANYQGMNGDVDLA